MRRVAIVAFVVVVVGITVAALWTSVFARGGIVVLVPDGSAIGVSVDGGEEIVVAGREIIPLAQGEHRVRVGEMVHDITVHGREDVFIAPVTRDQCYVVRDRGSGEVVKEYRRSEAFHVPRSYYWSDNYELAGCE